MAAPSAFMKTLQETVKLTNEKKINAKNAFEVDYFGQLDNVQEFIK